MPSSASRPDSLLSDRLDLSQNVSALSLQNSLEDLDSMFLQVRQCLDEGAVGRHVESPPDQLLGVLAVCLEFDSLDDVSVLELRQDGQGPDEADCQRVFHAV